jgi:DNA helicase-2/ATP-dependent DNA helicase PcrA
VASACLEAVLTRAAIRRARIGAVDRGAGRIENLQELIGSTGFRRAGRAGDYSGLVAIGGVGVGASTDDPAASPQGLARVQAFLEAISLVTDLDENDPEQSSVTLMTLHSAKGLEYPVVFLIGLEDGVFPHVRSLGDPDELGEERRCVTSASR